MLVLSRRVGEVIEIGEGSQRVTVEVVRISGDKVRIGVVAPDGVRVDRSEIADARRLQRAG